MTPLPDHQMTPQHETSTPAEDHPSTSTTKITEPITPRHQRSSGDQLRPVGAQAKINSKINCKITGGTPC